MIKDAVLLMARYNQAVNQRLFQLLQEEEVNLLTEYCGSYYGSILGLLNHILLGNLNWLSSFRDCKDLDIPILNNPALEFEHPGKGNLLYKDLTSLIDHEISVDEIFVRLVEHTGEDILGKSVELFKAKGRPRTWYFGHCLIHVFNHQTHHRGAIAQILDEKGIENDYSNVSQVFRNHTKDT